MFKILAQLFCLTLGIKLKQKQKFVNSWELASTNSSTNLLNNNDKFYKKLFESTPVNLSSNLTLKSGFPIQIQEVKPDKNDL